MLLNASESPILPALSHQKWNLVSRFLFDLSTALQNSNVTGLQFLTAWVEQALKILGVLYTCSLHILLHKTAKNLMLSANRGLAQNSDLLLL